MNRYALLLVLLPAAAFAQLDDSCVVSVLNRTIQVNAKGTWSLPNIPAGFGKVRARATCVKNGLTRTGQSDLFEITADGGTNVPPIFLGNSSAIPVSVSIASAKTLLTNPNETTQLTVTATYADNSTRNITAASTGTVYVSTNPLIASVSLDGLVTARSSGTVILQATNEGRPGLFTLRVTLGNDSDGDGIPDDVELANGLNPNDSNDSLGDSDNDGLTNVREYQLGTNIRKADTDGDGLTDGVEVNTHRTNPLLADTDGDRIPDNIEVQIGSNPLDRNSPGSLGTALQKIEVTPASFVIKVNTQISINSQQLTVTGTFVDGRTTVDLTATSTGTAYASSNLSSCSFGTPDGMVFGGVTGPCRITVSNSGKTAISEGYATSFTPLGLGVSQIDPRTESLGVQGNHIYLAVGPAGVFVYDLNLGSPVPVQRFQVDTPGTALRVIPAGRYAYVADSIGGVRVLDILDPTNASMVGGIAYGQTVQDIAVNGSLVYAADTVGLTVIDASNPASPTIRGSLALGPVNSITCYQVAHEPARALAAISCINPGLGLGYLHIVDVSNPATPVRRSTLTAAFSSAGIHFQAVAIRGNAVYLGFPRDLTTVDITNPDAPAILPNPLPRNTGGLNNRFAIHGSTLAGADVFFINGTPIIDISSPLAPVPRFIVNYSNFGVCDHQDVVIDAKFTYLVGACPNNGSRLIVGQWALPVDLGTTPPAITITAPAEGSQILRGLPITVSVLVIDDVSSAGVELFVNGVASGIFTGPTITLNPPAATGPYALRIRARDFAGNIAEKTVNITVINDPLTTLRGRALVDGANASGVSIACVSSGTASPVYSATSAADGTFSIGNVPTLIPNVTCTASKAGLEGVTAEKPVVRGGITDFGNLGLTSPLSGIFSLGQDFWISFNFLSFDLTPEMVLTGECSQATTVTLTLPAGGGTTSLPCEVASPAIFVLPNDASYVVFDSDLDSKGIHVTSSPAPISLNVIYRDEQTQGLLGGYRAIRTSGLGKQYLVANAAAQAANTSVGGVTVLATADTTTVTIGFKCQFSADSPVTVTLNQGQSQSLFCSDSLTGLDGTTVSSDKPVAVFSGHSNGKIPFLGAHSFTGPQTMATQAFPVDSPLWGTQLYLSAEFPGPGVSPPQQYYKLLVSQDNTQVQMRRRYGLTASAGAGTHATQTDVSTLVLNRGVYDFDYMGGRSSVGHVELSANKPISAVFYGDASRGSCMGNIVPAAQFQQRFQYSEDTSDPRLVSLMVLTSVANASGFGTTNLTAGTTVYYDGFDSNVFVQRDYSKGSASVVTGQATAGASFNRGLGPFLIGTNSFPTPGMVCFSLAF